MNSTLLVVATCMVAQAPPSRPIRPDGPAVRVAVRFCSQHSCSRIQYGSGMVTKHKKNGSYVVMTNFHVIKPVPHMTRKVWVMAHGNWYDAKVGAVGNNDIDLALLTIHSNGKLNVAPISEKPVPDGATVTVVSFRGKKRYMCQVGRMYDRSTTGGNIDGSDFLTVKIDDGQSGGGVLNSKGELVSLVYGVDKPPPGMRSSSRSVRHAYSGMGLCVDYTTMRTFSAKAGYKFNQYDEVAPAPPDTPVKTPVKTPAQVPVPVDTAPPEPPPAPMTTKPPKPVEDLEARKGIKELGGKVTKLGVAISTVKDTIGAVSKSVTNVHSSIEVNQSKGDERFGLLKGLIEKATAPKLVAPQEAQPGIPSSIIRDSAPPLLRWLGTAAGLSAGAVSGVGVAGSIGLWLYRRRKDRRQGKSTGNFSVQPHIPLQPGEKWQNPDTAPQQATPQEPPQEPPQAPPQAPPKYAAPSAEQPYSPAAQPSNPAEQLLPDGYQPKPQAQHGQAHIPDPTQVIERTKNRYVPVLQPDTYHEAVKYAHAKLVERYPESEGTVAFIDNVVDQYISGQKIKEKMDA